MNRTPAVAPPLTWHRGLGLLAAVLLLAACGSTSTSSSSAAVTPSAATTPAPSPTTGPASGRDQCLVGKWSLIDPFEVTGVFFQGRTTTVSGQTGLVITFNADGTEVDDFSQAQPATGVDAGNALTVTWRGGFTFTWKGSNGLFGDTPVGVLPGTTVTATEGGVNQPIPSPTGSPSAGVAYSCTPTMLTLGAVRLQRVTG